MTSDKAAPPRKEDEPKHLPTTFGLKDVFTCINILGGVASIICCIEGKLRWAGYAAVLGYALGDALDGLVARATNTGNRFGAQFDQAGDHFTQSIVPAFMVYIAYKPLSFWLAASLTSAIIISGSIRHARGAVVSPEFPMAYFGMPRTVSSFIILSYLLSSLADIVPGWRWGGIPLILFCCVAHVLPIPFRTHKGRKLKPYVKYFIIAFFGSTAGAMIIAPRFTFDVTLLWFVLYSLCSWLEMSSEELATFRKRAREWSAKVRAAR